MAKCTGLARTPLSVLVLSTVSFAAAAQVTPPDAGSLLNQQQRIQPNGLDRLPQNQNAAQEPAMRREAVGERIQINTIRFQGIEGLASEAELQALVAAALGHKLAFAEMEELAEKVTRYLKQKGWMLARAYLPRQDLTGGVLTIAVVQGRIEGNVTGNGIVVKAGKEMRLDPDRIRKTAAGATIKDDGAALTARDVERAVLLVNDLPGMQARSFLERGDVPGTTRMGLEVTEGPLVTGSAWIDNYGNRYTGSVRGNALVNLNDPVGWGDQLTVALTGAEHLSLGRLSYSLPVGYSGLRANTSASALEYKVGKEQAVLDSRGTARTVGAGLSYPILRSRDANLGSILNYDFKALQDKSLGAVTRDKRLDNVTLGLSGDCYDHWAGGGINNALMTYTLGHLDLGRNAADQASDRLTARTEGTFHKLNYSLARLQKLTDDLSLFGALNGQRASKNLDSSEKFILGGPAAVRAYPNGEASGDSGWVTNVELRYDLPALRAWGLGDFQAMGFYDTGRVSLQNTPWSAPANATGQNSYSLSGAGIGLNLTKTGDYSVRLGWATTLGSNPGRTANGSDSDGLRDSQRVWVQALVNF